MGFINRKVAKAFGLPETSMKDAREAMHAAPDLMRTAQEMQQNAMQMQAAQQAAAQQAMGAPPAAAMAAMGVPADTSGPDFQPISGVSLEQYASISKQLGAAANDQAQAHQVAMSQGITPENWDLAVTGWADRIRANRAVGQQFNHYYMAG